MASLSTKEELEQEIKALQAALALMVSPEQRVCLKCKAIYVRDGGRNQCYCDYESDRYD